MLKGDIYLANLNPSKGVEINKIRPVLVFQNDLACKYSQTVTVLPLSSTEYRKRVFEIQIKADKNNKLASDSKILVHQIRTVDKQRLGKKIGRASNNILSETEAKLKLHLGIV